MYNVMYDSYVSSLLLCTCFVVIIALCILQLHLQPSSGDGGLGTPGFGEGLPGFGLGLSACSLMGGTCAGNHWYLA